jgi:gliding motility-associated-like protein
VTPPAGGAQYTCKFVYPICNAGWSTCNVGIGNLGPDTVFVSPGPPTLNPPIVNIVNPTCNSYCDGIVNVTPTNGLAPYTYVWTNNANTSQILMGCCAGSYSVFITDANGCNVIANATLVDPPLVVGGPIIYSDTICMNSTNEIYFCPNIGPGYTYQWSTVGNITTGQGTNQISVDWNGVNNGFIPGGVQVTAYNPFGCSSLPVSVDLFVLNVLPVITPTGPFCSNDEFTILTATPIGGVFSGPGVMGDDFYPSNADTLNNIITYTYTQSGCVFDTTTDIIVYENPQITPITPYNDFFELCDGDTIQSMYSVISTLSGGYNEWTLTNNTTQTTNFNITWDTFGMFPLSVVNYVNGCPSNQEQTVITIVQCPNLLFYIPNSFTPDGNEHNNEFKWTFTSGFDPTDFHITIFNRWGEVIYESFNSNDYWDGTYNNNMCPEGSYTYKVNFGSKENDGEYVITGSLNLIK